MPVPMAHTGSYAITTFLQAPVSIPPGNLVFWHALPVIGAHEGDDGRELRLADLLGLVRLALGERLADAEDHGEAVVERDTRLLRDELGRLVEDRAALGVAEDDVGDAGVLELSGAGRALAARFAPGLSPLT